MGMCKGYGEIFSTPEIKNEYCKSCEDGSTKELNIEIR